MSSMGIGFIIAAISYIVLFRIASGEIEDEDKKFNGAIIGFLAPTLSSLLLAILLRVDIKDRINRLDAPKERKEYLEKEYKSFKSMFWLGIAFNIFIILITFAIYLIVFKETR